MWNGSRLLCRPIVLDHSARQRERRFLSACHSRGRNEKASAIERFPERHRRLPRVYEEGLNPDGEFRRFPQSEMRLDEFVKEPAPVGDSPHEATPALEPFPVEIGRSAAT